MFHVKPSLDTGEVAVAAALKALNLPLSLLSPLRAHALACAEASPRLGLVSAGDELNVMRRHTADALLFAVARRPGVGEVWLDVGTGGGFPGLPLAICFSETSFVVCDTNAKKVGFLELMVLELGLKNIQCEAKKAEDLRGEFDVVISRAVAAPSIAFTLLSRSVRSGGTMIVAGTGQVEGARAVQLDLPTIDSPQTLFIMTAASQVTRTDGYK